MFNTVSRARSYKRQEEGKPEPGVDSTYGVRSLGDSDFGSGVLGPQDEDRDEVAAGDEVQEEVEAVAQETLTPAIDQLPTEEVPPEVYIEASPSSPLLTSPNSPFNLPDQLEGYYRRTIPTPDDLSEPSSPASFASMPSYISSSLSRTSSLGPDVHGHGHRVMNYQYQYEYGIGMGGSEELVIPTLNVNTGPMPRSSGSGSGIGPRAVGGHATLEGDGGRGIKVMLLGNEEQVEDFVLRLRGWKEVIDLREGRWGIMGDDLVMTTICTGLSAHEVESRVENAYTRLDGALHPDPSPELRGQVQDLVAGYANKSDWVHLVISLGQDASTTAVLNDIVPIISTSDHATHPPHSQSPLMSPHAIPDPTPRPGVEGLSYFATHEPHADSAIDDLVSQLINTLEYPDKVQSASTAKFLTWRKSRRDLASSHASHSHSHSQESSASGEVAPMPTLARAQGGGEWEANLSRRLAQRRQSQSHSQPNSHSDQASNPKQGRRRGSTATSARPTKSRGTPKGKESCGPLFPSVNGQGEEVPSGKGIAGVGVGLGELVEKTFGGLRRRWKWGLVAAAAVALVVGWNWN